MADKKKNNVEGCCGGGCASCPVKASGERDCASCPSKGGGCHASSKEEGQGGCGSRKGCGGCCGGGVEPRFKLNSYNYLDDVPGGYADDDMVEVQFKNTRKGFFLNSAHLPLEVGDMVAVEAAPGHDIGMVTLTGALVRLQMRKANVKSNAETRRVFRKAKPADMERFEQAKARENETMIRARKIASSLQLNMKIGDVEYQGDGNKAIFYYIADERVDFRQLIKVLAETFKVRIEMKQIGARQEAGRIGGIGPCGRPLCCTTWMTNFVSVATSAARYQDISLNPQKLAGQCAKLKCCLNFEVDSYVEAQRKLPAKDVRLETADATYFYFKADIFRKEITYSTDKNIPANLVTISAARAFEVIAMNKAGEKPLVLKEEGDEEKKPSEYGDIIGQDSLTRFDKKKKKKKPSGAKKEGAADAQKGDGDRRQPSAAKGQGGSPKGGDNPQRNNGDRRKPKGEPNGEQPRQQQKGGGQQPDRKPQEGKAPRKGGGTPDAEPRQPRGEGEGKPRQPRRERPNRDKPAQNREGGTPSDKQRERRPKRPDGQKPKEDGGGTKQEPKTE